MNTVQNLNNILAHTKKQTELRIKAIKDECFRRGLSYTRIQEAEVVEKITIKKDSLEKDLKALDFSLQSVCGMEDKSLLTLLSIQSNNLRKIEEGLESVKNDSEYTAAINSQTAVSMLYYLRDKYAKKSERKLINQIIGRVAKKHDPSVEFANNKT